MRLDIATVNHQPLQVGVIGHGVQQFGPVSVLAPTAKPAMGGAAVAVVQGQVALGGTGAENPEHGVYEAAVVLGRPASGWALLAEPF